MAEYLIQDTTLTSIADAIREKTGGEDAIAVNKFPSAISEISTGVDTSDATASAKDIASGKTAYINGGKVTGSLEAFLAGKTYVGVVTVSTGDADGDGAGVNPNKLSGVTTVAGDIFISASDKIIGFRYSSSSCTFYTPSTSNKSFANMKFYVFR